MTLKNIRVIMDSKGGNSMDNTCRTCHYYEPTRMGFKERSFNPKYCWCHVHKRYFDDTYSCDQHKGAPEDV